MPGSDSFIKPNTDYVLNTDIIYNLSCRGVYYTDSVYVDLCIHTFFFLGEKRSCIAPSIRKHHVFDRSRGVTNITGGRQGATPEPDSDYAECYKNVVL